MTTVFHAWPYDRFIEIQSNLRKKKLRRTNQVCNFPGGSFFFLKKKKQTLRPLFMDGVQLPQG